MADKLSKRLQKTARAQVTVEDVARAAGVSTASVSRVLNDDSSVSPELRAKVERQIGALGYVRHGAARSLRSLRSLTVGAVIPTLENAIFAAGIDAFERRLHDDGYTLLVALSGYDLEHEAMQVRRLLERGVDGMMLIGDDHAPATYDLLGRSGVHAVNTWTYETNAEHACVGFDNRAATRKIVHYLVGMGHRRIAVISGITEGNDRARARVEGVRAGLGDHGLELPASLLLERKYGIAEGRHALRALMEAEPRPTAIVCGNDVLAYGALFACADLGIVVPDDVSITGFDDLPLTAQLRPALSTIHVPSREMGRRAAEYLLEKLASRPVSHATELAAELVVRDTTSSPPAATTLRTVS
ncbi:MAG: LacI family DNA-binding transcriptional regulator [Methyloligellaceae bacterium]